MRPILTHGRGPLRPTTHPLLPCTHPLHAQVVAVDFGTGAVSATARPGTHLAHGALNFLAWSVLLPAGVFMARFTKRMAANADVAQVSGGQPAAATTSTPHRHPVSLQQESQQQCMCSRLTASVTERHTSFVHPSLHTLPTKAAASIWSSRE